MTLKVALQMDNMAFINPESDSSLLLAYEAQNRGFQLFYYQVEDLYLLDNQVMAWAYELELTGCKKNFYKLSNKHNINLQDINILLMRQDPPFNLSYITATYLLDKLKSNKTLILNNPTEVRNSPEKLLVFSLAEFTPPTLISSNLDTILDFLHKYKKAVIKPLYSFGGKDVFLLKEGDDNVIPIIEMFKEKYNYQFIVQQYLSNVKSGDKRIIFVEGEILGAFKRIPNHNSIKTNLVVGGRAVPTELSDKELEICKKVGILLKEKDLFLVGIDLIDEQIIEINTTSPTGLTVLNKFYNLKTEQQIWDKIIIKSKGNIL